MKSWKRSLLVSTTIGAMLAVTASVLQAQVSASLAAANLKIVRSEGQFSARQQSHTQLLNQISPALAAIATPPASASQTTTVAQNRALTIEDFTVGGISLRSTEAQVREWLGTPETAENLRESVNGQEIHSRYLYYNRRGIHGMGLEQDPATGEFVVRSLLVNGKESRTAAGIGVGDSGQKLLDLYGQPERVWHQGDTMDYWYYYSPELGMELQFTVLKEGDRISEIILSRTHPLTFYHPN